jgi:hypothetical protein
MSTKPLVNSWTEFGTLETCVVGAVHNDDCHFEQEPNYCLSFSHDTNMNKYMNYPCGKRAKERIRVAQQQLENLKEVLEGEVIQVKNVREFDDECQKEL